MRDIKFRGIVSDDCEFDGDVIFTKGQIVYGHLITDDKGNPYIMGDMIEMDNEMTLFESWIAVDKDSVGQYTGLHDINGKEIYEGDLIETGYSRDKQAVWFDNNTASYYLWASAGKTIPLNNSRPLKLIGSVYENPELLDAA